MGDGRYYTAAQFLSVIYLTFIIIFMAIRLVQNLYRGSDSKINRAFFVMDLGLLLLGLLYFFESILVSQHTAYISRLISSMLLVIMNFMMCFFVINHIIGIHSRTRHWMIRLAFVGMTSLIVLTCFLPEMLIASYTYSNVTYGATYIVAQLLGLFGLGLLTIIILKKKQLMRINLSKWIIIFSMIIFWIVPLLMYNYVLIQIQSNSLLFEYILLSLFAAGLGVVSSILTPYHVSTSVFSDVRELMLDYVFITDEAGAIIYRNESVEKSEFFYKLSNIDLDCITSLFKDEVILKETYKKQIIELLSDKMYYLSYTKKQIIKGEQPAGYILTFSDISYMIDMLNELEQKEAETKHTNEELIAYKEIVYEVEKDKEINYLLTEVAANQQKSMERLKNDIKDLENIEEGFIEAVTQIIDYAKNDLQDVRQAVTTYRTYYGREL
ncbi:MAG: hypothetical protein PF505_03520 [Vallitaleaceae bacterium]|jgi:hypothetical protein|nr:hypothetical protein [Vallitaleaceae bacterium]